MAEEFNYDPERDEETNARALRLPFALCKQKGIKVEDWWTPRNAWDALQRGGHVDDVSEEYKEYFKNKKREQAKAKRKEQRKYNERKKKQLADPQHNPDKNYKNQPGKIAGVEKGDPMTFEQADSGNVNPYFGKGLIGYRHNCQTCVATYIARRNGYDVRALPNLNNKAISDLSYRTNLAYVDKNGKHPQYINKRAGERTLSFLQNNVKDGRIYAFEYKYKGKSMGHIVTVEKQGGEVVIYDPQTNIRCDNPREISDYIQNTERHKLMDLSDVSLDEKFCDNIMKRR